MPSTLEFSGRSEPSALLDNGRWANGLAESRKAASAGPVRGLSCDGRSAPAHGSPAWRGRESVQRVSHGRDQTPAPIEKQLRL